MTPVELDRIREKMDYVEAHADEGGTGSPANLQELVGYIRLLLAALSPSDAEATEPVAFRWRNRFTMQIIGDREWNYTAAKLTSGELLEVEPLYAAPPIRGDREQNASNDTLTFIAIANWNAAIEACCLQAQSHFNPSSNAPLVAELRKLKRQAPSSNWSGFDHPDSGVAPRGTI